MALAIAVATFIENDFGAETARAHVYNATWFELLFVLAGINLAGNLIMHRVYRKGRLSILLFHLSFLLILVGAGITRYLGFTGSMHIREGKSSSIVSSDEAYLTVQVLQGDHAFEGSRKILLSWIRNQGYLFSMRTGGTKLRMRYISHLADAVPILEASPEGKPALILTERQAGSMVDHLLYESESRWIGGVLFHFNRDLHDGVRLYDRNDSLFFSSPCPVNIFRMGDSLIDALPANDEHVFERMNVYGFATTRLVLSDFQPSAEVLAVRSAGSGSGGRNALTIRMESNGMHRDITLWGGRGRMGEPRQARIGNMDLLISYGSVGRVLPFSLRLDDFILERYPGSDSPSSFESVVYIDDPAEGLLQRERIFMNHILKYRGYRFYQSSYDADEKGTILSVNKDRFGTSVTYTGYFLLFLGLLMTLTNPDSRFRALGRNLASARAMSGKGLFLLLIAGLSVLIPIQTRAAGGSPATQIPSNHTRSLASLLVQDHQGRIKPMNTLSSEALRKVSRRKRINGAGPEEVLLGMMTDPVTWQTIPMIRVSHPEIQDFLGIEGNYARFVDFFRDEGTETYRLAVPVREAHRKNTAVRSKFDAEILRVDERVNICYMVFTGALLRILPDRDDESHTWHSPLTIQTVYSGDDSLFASSITGLYLDAVVEAGHTGDWSAADEYLGYIKLFQDRMGGEVLPAKLKVRAEILYNRIMIFERLARFYLSIGIILLFIQLVNVIGSQARFRWLRRVMVIHLLAGFGVHTVGLAVRWYISGHAPWSNGYESLIYISWATMLAGTLFARRTPTPLAATAVLSWMILHTAHLSWMDPQVTNLVPVLKSYWLTIHVAVIASSYGFLGLTALMGFLNLVLMALMGKGTGIRDAIGTLSGIAEMAMIAGLALLTTGTFLGGIWANESWGRYWAWDPKESWALITILVYAFVAHMRFVPGLQGRYAFNLASVLGFASVLMTYFGVNFYLSGMHSYAAGDPVPVPSFVWYTLGIILLVSILGYRGNLRFNKKYFA